MDISSQLSVISFSVNYQISLDYLTSFYLGTKILQNQRQRLMTMKHRVDDELTKETKVLRENLLNLRSVNCISINPTYHDLE
jgi:hypothetical protein